MRDRRRQTVVIGTGGGEHTAAAATWRAVQPGDIDRPLTSTDLASDVVGLLQHLDIAQADVLGLSVGGAVALHLAIRHPGLVRKLVVSSASAQPVTVPRTPRRWRH